MKSTKKQQQANQKLIAVGLVAAVMLAIAVLTAIQLGSFSGDDRSKAAPQTQPLPLVTIAPKANNETSKAKTTGQQPPSSQPPHKCCIKGWGLMTGTCILWCK